MLMAFDHLHCIMIAPGPHVQADKWHGHYLLSYSVQEDGNYIERIISCEWTTCTLVPCEYIAISTIHIMVAQGPNW